MMSSHMRWVTGMAMCALLSGAVLISAASPALAKGQSHVTLLKKNAVA